MITAIWTIVIFCVLVAVHEFGHFICAKLSGMTVHEFAIGMGPKIFGREKGGTRYTLRLLPIGGFCQLEGEDGGSGDAGAFCNKPAWKRLIVLAAGATMNLLLGFLIFVMLFSFSPAMPAPVAGEVAVGSAFEEAGFIAGDRIVAVSAPNGKRATVHIYQDLALFLSQNPDMPITFTAERDGVRHTAEVEARMDETQGRKVFGIVFGREHKSVWGILRLAFFYSIFVVKMVVMSILMLLTGQLPVSSLSGPVGIVNEINNAAKMGVGAVAEFAGLISINLGVANLLPFPALDGGRILLLGVEKLRGGKKLKPEHEGMLNFIGFALLILLLVIVTFGDVRRIFGA
ncbi:MAG: site-2 protease family protein [Ruminococcaceae bacterium]|nr:site-2 protease family protein [Oscillospiraceae bacterium]